MSLYIDIKYTNLISNRFESFAKKGDFLFACRCPVCGDSKKNKLKMRGYIFRKANDLYYKCHNCSVGMTLGNLLKYMDENLYKQYIFERYSNGEGGHSNFKQPTFEFKAVKFDKLEKKKEYENAQVLSDLPEQHYCVQYAKNRRIPEQYFSEFFFTDKFASFAKELFPDLDKTLYEDSRLVLPLFDKYDEVVGVFARALAADNKLRYVRLNPSNNPTLFGEVRLNTKLPVKIVEGAIDSLFLSNTVASGDSSLSIAAKRIKADKIILVYDNEPRNIQIIKLISNSIDQGHNVVIWPDTIEEKDINEMIIAGRTTEELEKIIEENTYSGLQANLKFNSWRKC